MDFAFLNASTLAGFFPPEDPWLRGGDVPYYYFGYLMMGNLTELTFIPSRISYNLALALIPAMGGMAAFGLTYNLARAHGASVLKGAQFALLAPVLLLAVSNLEGILEFASMRGWGGESFWQWVGIKDLGSGGGRFMASNGASLVVARHAGHRHAQRAGRQPGLHHNRVPVLQLSAGRPSPACDVDTLRPPVRQLQLQPASIAGQDGRAMGAGESVGLCWRPRCSLGRWPLSTRGT